MAALCHDLGHLPFSHAAEKELLPDGWDHETITLRIIDNMEKIWDRFKTPVRGEDIKKLAVGPKKYKEKDFSDWEILLSDIIVGDAFGADRIDYLLRDSHYAGVAYGKFDHHRLLDTLRLLPKEYQDSDETAIGVEEGGIFCAESLLWARYLMFSQVYMHPIKKDLRYTP